MNPKQNIPDLIKQLQIRMSASGMTQKMIAERLYPDGDSVNNYNKRFLQRYLTSRFRRDEIVQLIEICKDVITPIEAIRLIYWSQIPEQEMAIASAKRFFDSDEFASMLDEFQSRYIKLHLEPIDPDLSDELLQVPPVSLPFFSDIDVQKLVGVDPLLDELVVMFQSERIISIQGIGGIGKTSLALALSRHVLCLDQYEYVTWVNIEHKRLVNGREEDTSDSVVSHRGIILQLAQKLIQGINPQDPLDIHVQKLAKFFQTHRCFVIIDNIETLDDIVDLMRHIDLFTRNETRFLLTSRVAVNTRYALVTPYDIEQLSVENSYQLLSRRAQEQSMTIDRKTVERIYHNVGGIPLALHLIASLIGDVDFETFIADIENVADEDSIESQRIDALFRFIYMNLWQLLSENAKQLFVRLGRMLPDTGRSLSWIKNHYEKDDLIDRLNELKHYYIVMRYGDVLEATYYMHPLSKTFIQNQRYRRY